ncbi:MAG: hypothetical protein ACI4N4_05920 [Candidatus Fimenecus sp.]
MDGEIIMNMYRIAKYDLNGYVDGVFIFDDWTDYSDIGNIFNGKEFTSEMYLEVEDKYIKSAQDIFIAAHQKELSITNLQKYQSNLIWKNNQMIDKLQLAEIIRDCLRNRCWCRLSSEDFYIHFGYDYYMYIGCMLPYDTVTKICAENQLYVIECESPYLNIDQE